MSQLTTSTLTLSPQAKTWCIMGHGGLPASPAMSVSWVWTCGARTSLLGMRAYIPQVRLSLTPLQLLSKVRAEYVHGPNAPIHTLLGVGVYVFCLISGDANMRFVLDGQSVGKYSHALSNQTAYAYNVLVYSNSTLPAGQHTIQIQNGSPGNQSLALLDHIVYTYVISYHLLSLSHSCFTQKRHRRRVIRIPDCDDIHRRSQLCHCQPSSPVP